MAIALCRRIARWIVDTLLWDVRRNGPEGFRGVLWKTRKLSAALTGSALLTGWEWAEHHPPEIALIELIHFFLMLAMIALIARARQAGREGRRARTPDRVRR